MSNVCTILEDGEYDLSAPAAKCWDDVRDRLRLDVAAEMMGSSRRCSSSNPEPICIDHY